MPGRYIPPHLRGRCGSSNNSDNNNKHERSNTSTQSVGGSRWRDLDNGGNSYSGTNSNNNNNNNGYGHRFGGRNSSNEFASNRQGGGNASGNSGKSRWANVNRSAIEAGNRSPSRYTNHNNRRFHNSRSGYNKFHHVKAIFFGDSFIKLFGLLNDYSDSVLKTPHPIEVQKYKAASAKGLCREGNENRAKILKTMETIRRRNELRSNGSDSIDGTYQNLERLVFCFGSVDVHMSFYFKKYVQNQPLSDDDLRKIANDYVDFVANLETTDASNKIKPPTKLIVGIYPSPLCDKDVGASLLAYGSLENEEQVAFVNDSNDKLIELRQARVDLFNKALAERCEFYNQQAKSSGKSNGILEYWDVREDLLIIDKTSDRLRVKDAYKDVSDLNIHLIHETTLQLWVQKWPWYEALTSGSRNPKSTSFLDYLQETFDEYRKTKPWAERTHVAETRGIQLSL